MIIYYMNLLKYIKQCLSLKVFNLNFIDNDFDGNLCIKLKECIVKGIRECFYILFYKMNMYINNII